MMWLSKCACWQVHYSYNEGRMAPIGLAYLCVWLLEYWTFLGRNSLFGSSLRKSWNRFSASSFHGNTILGSRMRLPVSSWYDLVFADLKLCSFSHSSFRRLRISFWLVNLMDIAAWIYGMMACPLVLSSHLTFLYPWGYQYLFIYV